MNREKTKITFNNKNINSKLNFLILIVLIILFSIFYSFQVRNLASYNYVYFYVYNFLPILKNNSKLIGKNIDIDTIQENKLIEEQNKESANFLATLFFSPTYFEYYRKSTRKGFESIADINFNKANYNFVFYKKEFIDNFYYKTTTKFKITKSIISYTQAILNTTGIKTYGEYPFQIDIINAANFKLEDNLFIYGLKKTCENLIKNSVYIKYGRNFVYKVSGSFILLETPKIFVNSGVIYFKINGYVIFNKE